MFHIYCGEGKGKTTSAVGLAIRAVGAGKKVYFFQFLKDGSSSEISVLRKIDGINVKCCEVCSKFTFQMTEEEKRSVYDFHNSMLEEAKSLSTDENALIILDEFCGAYNSGLVEKSLAENTVFGSRAEIVITGRNPDDKFLSCADYVSEIKAVRHPYTKGVTARKGIEY